MKKIAIIQSNYIPWKGYFDIINFVDEFIFFDHVQYTRRDWRNRNMIKTAQGPKWLTIPVATRGSFDARICDIQVADQKWRKKHWGAIQRAYSRSAYFNEYSEQLKSLYLDHDETFLSHINFEFVTAINRILGIKTKMRWSHEFDIAPGKNDQLLSVCSQLNATHYLSGPAARSYIDELYFMQNNVTVEWMDYSGYPEYQQLYPPFEHTVTVLDLIFNTGPDARKYMKSFQ